MLIDGVYNNTTGNGVTNYREHVGLHKNTAREEAKAS